MNYLGLDKEKVGKIAGELNILLSTYQVHYQKLRNFHWNIKNKSFFILHEKFEELYNETNLAVDEIAERILTLQMQPLSKMSDYLDNSLLKEESENLKGQEMVEEVLADYTTIISQMRKIVSMASDANDEGTVTMIGEYIGKLEKHGWMLSAWLDQHEVPESKSYGSGFSNN
jgi:starvation-inducible DNA-binding protein